MKRITTTEEFDNGGKLIKRMVVEETDFVPVCAPYIQAEPFEWPGLPVTYHTEITCEK